MSLPARQIAVVLSREELAEEIERAVAPLRLELERLRAERAAGPITIPEAARRLNVTVRAVQRWLKDGRLEAVPVGGVRMVRWPQGAPPR